MSQLSAPVAAAAKSLQSCPTLCGPMDRSPSGSAVPGILQARTLEWVAISFSNACKWKVKVKSLSRVRPSATPWTAAFQAPPSMGFSRQEYWSGVPLPSPSLLLSRYQKEIFWCMCQNVPWILICGNKELKVSSQQQSEGLNYNVAKPGRLKTEWASHDCIVKL